MRAGKLRRRITLQQATLAANALGEMIPTWADWTTNIPAEIVPNNGKEAIIANQVNAQQPIIVTIRYLAGMTPQMRVVYQGRTFEISSVANIHERNADLELTCIEHQ